MEDLVVEGVGEGGRFVLQEFVFNSCSFADNNCPQQRVCCVSVLFVVPKIVIPMLCFGPAE